MKIIKNNYNSNLLKDMLMPREIICPHCKSELEYNQMDVHAERRLGGLKFIVCGACKKDIELK